MISLETTQLSERIFGGGLVVQRSDAVRHASSIDRSNIIRLFEEHGVILFRGFDLTPDEVVPLTDLFTELYASDALRRVERFGPKGEARSVDSGHDLAPLHSEASFGATWPELLWFFCNTPSSSGGSTTLCDGISLWDKLSRTTQAFFLAQPLRYRISFPTGTPQPGRGKVPWPFRTVGVDGVWDKDTGTLHLQILRYAVHEARNRRLCFANHVICDDPLIDSMTMADGTSIPQTIVEEIAQASLELTVDLHWNRGELLMLDNQRFLHGRRAFSASDPRDILQIQTALASFGYGATQRTQITR